MMDQSYIIGRLVEIPEVTKDKTQSTKASITLAVPRPFKNVDGIYEDDYIDCELLSFR